MKEITQQWLNFAEKDLRSCNNNIKDKYLTNIVAFHCQQTVEKCFKAITEENGLRLNRIHSLLKNKFAQTICCWQNCCVETVK